MNTKHVNIRLQSVLICPQGGSPVEQVAVASSSGRKVCQLGLKKIYVDSRGVLVVANSDAFCRLMYVFVVSIHTRVYGIQAVK